MDNEEFDLEEDKRSESNASGMDKLMNFIKENTKLVIVLVVVLLLIILMIAFSGGGSNNTGITISEKTLTVTTDTGNQLKLMKDGKEVTGVVWTSKDSSIVSVDKTGVIKGLKVGKTTVIGKYDGHEYECEVTVTEGDPNLKVESLKFSESGTIIMPVGSTYQVPIQMTPPEAKPKNKIFASSKPEIASIDVNTGLITANAKGEAMIRVAVNDAEKMASIKIKVVEGQITPGIYTIPTSIAFDEKEITLTEGETKTLTYHQEPAEASTDYVIWVSADEEVATVFNGELIAKKPGNIEVAIVSMGLKDTMVVHVKSGTVPVTGINLSSEESITMNVGDQKKIVATVEPSNATNQVVTYLVDNPSVVSVDNDGNISAIGSGSTTITVSPSSNLEIKKTIYVTVNEDTSYVPPTDDGGNNGGNDGGNSGGETVTVGTVIVTGTNNSVSTELPGIEVENTTVTMTPSGNVEEIRYCKYDKAVSSNCTPQNIYMDPINLPEVTVTSKKVYVFKIVPVYQGKKGQEIVRYVTIKAGSTPSDNPPDDPVNPPDDPVNPPSSDVGELIISGLHDSRSDAEANNNVVSIATIVVTKTGNVDKFKYCHAAIGGSCPSYSTQSLSSGSYSFTLNTPGTYLYEFIPIYNNTEGAKVIKYVRVGTPVSPPANEEHCYVSSSSQGIGTNFTWGTKPTNARNVVQAKALDKREWCNAAKQGYLCFKDNGNNYYWGSNFSVPETYIYQPGITRQSDCLAKNPSDRCYCNSSGQCIWGQARTGYTVSAYIPDDKNECERYIGNGNQGCFTYNGKLVWGSYMNKSNYAYMSHVERSNCQSAPTKTDPTCPTTMNSYEGYYDGKEHSITVSGGSGGTIEYRTSTSGTWSTTKPTRKDVGTTTVYVRIKGDSTHNDKECGSRTITIKAVQPAEEGCFCMSNGLCKTTSGGTGYTKISGVTKEQCQRYINRKGQYDGEQTGCFIKKSNSMFTWGAYMAKTSEYTYFYEGSSNKDNCTAKISSISLFKGASNYGGVLNNGNIPVIGFETIKGNIKYGALMFCYYTSSSSNPSISSVASSCKFPTGNALAPNYAFTSDNELTDLGQGIVFRDFNKKSFTKYKIPEQTTLNKWYYVRPSGSAVESTTDIAFEFEWLSKAENRGVAHPDKKLIFAIAPVIINSNYHYIPPTTYTVYSIDMSDTRIGSSGTPGRYMYWKVTKIH